MLSDKYIICISVILDDCILRYKKKILLSLIRLLNIFKISVYLNLRVMIDFRINNLYSLIFKSSYQHHYMLYVEVYHIVF